MLDIADIKTEFGAYYIGSGQNLTRLVRQLRDKAVTDQLFTTRVTDDTKYQASETRTERLLQPFQKSWTPIGGTEFVPISIEQFKMKMDHEQTPDDIEASWLGFLADNNLDRKAWPLIRWLIEAELLPQLKKDYELNEIYKGVFAQPANGTAGAAGTAMNGIEMIINGHITSGRISPISMGAMPTDNVDIVNYFEDFCDQINDLYWGEAMVIGTNPQIKRAFDRGYKAKYGKDTDYTTNTKGAVDMTNFVVQGLPSMRGKNKIWTSPKDNCIRLVKKSANIDKVMVESVDRTVKIFTDWWTGIGFLIPEIVFTNDLELPTP